MLRTVIVLQWLRPTHHSGFCDQVVHVSPDMRKAYIGDSSDRTVNGKSIMAFNKSWRSLPIQSWSGGMKIAGGLSDFCHHLALPSTRHAISNHY